MKTEDIMMAARCYAYGLYPWYGHICMILDWKESQIGSDNKTIGSRITSNGITINYNPDWVQSMVRADGTVDNDKITNAIKHVIDHLVRLHPLRKRGRNGKRWDLACFTPSELIIGDISKSICEIKRGDFVVGRTGDLTQVVNIMNRDYNGKLLNIKARYLDRFLVTPDHPILVADWKLKTTYSPKTTIKIYSEPRFIKANELKAIIGSYGQPARSGMSLVVPKLSLSHTNTLDLSKYISDSSQSRPRNRKLTLDKDLAWIFGLYVAEGSHQRNNCIIQFNLSADEIDVAENLKAKFNNLGYNPSYRIKKPNLIFTVGSPILAKAFGEWFGRSAHTKRIPYWLLTESNKEIIISFLMGYLEGDGTTDGHRNSGYTVSEILAKQIQLMAFSHDIPFGIYYGERPSRVIGKYTLPIEKGYTIEANNWQINEAFLQNTNRRKRSFYQNNSNSIYLPIIEITKEDYTGKVYNIETAEHTYLVSNAVVHNCDMVVNGHEHQAHCGKPFDNMIFLPRNWDEDTAEVIYEKIVDDPEDSPSDDHSQWDQCELAADEARQMIASYINDANSKSPGSIPGHLESAIKELHKPIVSWKQLLRGFLGRMLGGKRMTYSRLHKKHQAFGIKGTSRRATSECVVIVDTSGSISENDMAQFFAEIESIMHCVKVTVVLWDAALQGVFKYRKGMWKTIKISGGGGTDMAAPVDYVLDNRLAGNAIIMLTDGYVSSWPSKKDIFAVFCITSPVSDLPDWGHVVRLDVG